MRNNYDSCPSHNYRKYPVENIDGSLKIPNYEKYKSEKYSAKRLKSLMSSTLSSVDLFG